MRPVVKAGLAGLAAYLLWPRSGGNDATGPVDSGATDWSKVYLTYCVGDALDAPGYVLSTQQPDPVPLTLDQDGKAHQGASPSWRQLFKKQVEDPAGRVRCSDVQQYHFILAQTMLSGQMPRDDKAGSLYKRVLDLIAQNKKDAEDLNITNQVISGIAAVIPVIGGAIKLAVGTGLQAGIKGALQNAANEAEALQSIDQIAVGMGANSPEGRMWLSNTDASVFPDPKLVHGTEVWTEGLSTRGGFYVSEASGEAVFPAEALSVIKSTINGQTAQRLAVKAGYHFVPSGFYIRLFAMYEYGWILPWLSTLLGSDDTLERQIAIVSPVVRAFDIVRTKMFPIAPDGTGKQNRYFYITPKHGLMMGACCPPTSEDVRYNNGTTHYDFNGRDITNATIRKESAYGPAADGAALARAAYNSPTSPSDAPPVASPEDYGQVAPKIAAESAVSVTSSVAVRQRGTLYR